MSTTMNCIPCFVRQAAEAVNLCVPDESRRAGIMRSLLAGIAEADWNASSPAVAQQIHRLIRKATGDPDPYLAMKERMNKLALDLLPCLIRAARLEERPRAAMTRIALAGNLIDAGAKSGLSETNVRSAVCRACGEDIRGPCREMFRAAKRAKQILFLADNAGEIVFDRVLIEALPREKMHVAVRGSPVINDATLADAELAGLPALVRVVSNGSDAPGTVTEDCSDAFRRIFDDSDLIISKGQGNYESLAGTNKHAFFLMLVKCHTVSAQIGAPVGAMVIHEVNGQSSGTTDPDDSMDDEE